MSKTWPAEKFSRTDPAYCRAALCPEQASRATSRGQAKILLPLADRFTHLATSPDDGGLA